MVFCNTTAGDCFWWYYKEKCFLYFLALIQSSQELFVLKAVPQRCSTKKVFCKYAASLLDFRNILTWSNNIAQLYSPLSFILSDDENLSVVAEECLIVLGKSTCINEQAELNIAKEN